MTVRTAEKERIKYLSKISWVKSHFPMCILLFDFPAAAISYIYSSFWSLAKGFFIILGTAGS